MTYVATNSPELDEEEAGDASADMIEALRDILDNRPMYDHAKEYDDINLWEVNALSREGRTLRQSDIEFDPNFCAVVIDSVANKMKISGITASSGSATDKAATADATDVLNNVVWGPNKLRNYYRVWQRSACRDGDGYIVVWPQELQDSEPDETGASDLDDPSADFGDAEPMATTTAAPAKATKVNVTYADPRRSRMFYDPENPRRKRYFAQLWEITLKGEKKPRLRLNLYYPDRIEKYVSGAGTRDPKPADFERYVDADHDGDNDYEGETGDFDDDAVSEPQWPMPNPYGVIPVFHLRTDLEYGKPVHRNAFALQDAVSRIIEMQMVTVEFQGYPQRYAIQEADSLGTQSIREDPLAEHSPADWDHDFAETAYSTTTITAGAISNETGSNYEASPGGMQVFKNFKEVGAFSSADPNAFLEPWREYCKAISSTTNTPLYKFQGLGGQVPSGEALKIIEAPLLDQVEFLFDMFGDTWEEALEFALLLVGVPDATVTITWANPATTDIMEVWQLVELKTRLGVPREQAFIEAGVPERQAQEWAKTYAADFALAQQEQGRAQMFMAQGESARWQVVAAKVAAGVPQKVALVEAGEKEADVDQWIADQADNLDMTRRVLLLTQIASAAQSLGSAVTLGVMNPEQVQQVIVGVLGDILPADEAPEETDQLGPDQGGAGGGGPMDQGQPDQFGSQGGGYDQGAGTDQTDYGTDDQQSGDQAGYGQGADQGFADRQANAQYEFVG